MQRSLARCCALAAAAAVAGPLCGGPVSAGTRARTLAVIYPMPSVSIAPAHLLQVNIVNASSTDADASQTDLVVRGRLLDSRGVELVRSGSQTVPRGATFSWTITQTDLAGAARDTRGRTQVRAEVDILGTLRVGAFVPSLELVNEATGEGGGLIGDIRTVISAEADFSGQAKRDFY